MLLAETFPTPPSARPPAPPDSNQPLGMRRKSGPKYKKIPCEVRVFSRVAAAAITTYRSHGHVFAVPLVPLHAGARIYF